MRPLFFLWIPKVGGGTLHNTFLRMYKRRHVGKSWTQRPGADDLTFSDEDYIVGHWPASVIPYLPNPITVVLGRATIQRVISHYNYVHEHGYHYNPAFTEWVQQATFREWLDSDYSRHAASNLQCRFLCDRETDNLRLAVKRLREIDVVGALEDGLQPIVDRCAELTGVAPVTVEGHYNQSKKVVTLEDLDNNTITELYERNSKDLSLYNSVKAAL